MKTYSIILPVCSLLFMYFVGLPLGQGKVKIPAVAEKTKRSYTIVDTGQVACYNDWQATGFPTAGQPYHGQDAQYQGNAPSYRDNKDGTITDLNTGLMWSKTVDTNKVSLEEAKIIAKKMTLGGHRDWRVPNIKELYSLIDFKGYTGFSGSFRTEIPGNAIPYINTKYFDFKYGNIRAGERYIDAQWLSSTKYVSTTMGGSETLFGVNFADGRIKGYGYRRPGRMREKKFYARYVRGAEYGKNEFVDNDDGTITDKATGLTWMKTDSGKAMTWKEALEYAENSEFAGHKDWRLPNAKELHSIVDYSRSPDTTNSAAINPIFDTTFIINESWKEDYPCFWTSTTHLDGPVPASRAAYIAFGRALGKMHGKVMDVHGAGAQRSDPKKGTPALGHGPQGDAIRVYNYVRCVRGGDVKKINISSTKSAVGNTRNFRKSGNRFSNQNHGFSQRNNGKTNFALERFIRRLDKNGDNKVSRQEFDGPDRHFTDHDKNRDGYITADEAPTGPPPHMRQRGQRSGHGQRKRQY